MDETFFRRRHESKLDPVPNPFSNEAPWTLYEIIKCIIVACWMLPSRLFVLCWCLFWEVVVARFSVFGTTLSEDNGCFRHTEPFGLWRRVVMAPLAILNRIAMICIGFWPGCIKVNDHRADKSKRANILVVAPHMTFVDSLMIAVAFPPVPSGVGMTGILDYPVMGRLAIAGQTIFVDRANPESRHSCKKAIQMRAGKEWSGPPAMIFPEGVITNGKALVQFKVGAFSAGESVTPVCLRYPWKHYNPSGCGKNCNVGISFLRMMLQFVNFCEMDILDTYEPSPAEVADPILYAGNVRAKMASHLGVPVTEHSYDDAFLNYESKAHVGSDFIVSDLKKLYDCTYDDLKRLLRTFEMYDTKNSGAITFKDFQEILQTVGHGPRDMVSAEHIFAFFDLDESGAIEYRDFVQVAALLSGQCSPTSRAKLAFLVYDEKGEGRVKRGLLRRAIDNCVAHPQGQADGRRRGSSASSCSEMSSKTQRMCMSPGDLLLPLGDECDELDFEAFSRLVEAQPDVLESAIELLRQRLSIPWLGSPQLCRDLFGADEKSK